jgi:glycosyltransferase involved in cell wall biosynthesis
MKLVTFVVPSYNSQDYLKKCLDSLVIGGLDVEVIVVNDGSKDDTEAIALEYVQKYPDICRLISKENGGHGSAINEGLKHANGLFFKVVDSDDWLDRAALIQLLEKLKQHLAENRAADLYICNFIYDKTSANAFFIRTFHTKFKSETFMTWKNVKKFYGAQVLLMHSLIYKTEKLRESHITLPDHTFYVDNLFAYIPLPYMKTIFYMDINLYHYFIGREDQSVNIKVFTNRYTQQIRVMKEMVKAYPYEEIAGFEKGLKKYMFHCLFAIMTVTILFSVAKDEKQRRIDLANMWTDIKKQDKRIYHQLQVRSFMFLLNFIPWRLKGFLMVKGYKFFRKKLKLG